MATTISPLASVAPSAKIGSDVQIGPFCLVGPHAKIGDESVLDSHVTVVGNTVIGARNRLWPNAVIGCEPQDVSYDSDAPTGVVIGDDNIFREGVTVNRGAVKEDNMTRIGNSNMLMSNSHVAHNCHIGNHTFLVNGVLLGGHVHVQDRAIVSGNSVVHHFATIGTLAFVSGGCRVPTDILPYMLACGSDNPEVRTINIVGMRRAGISESTIRVIKRAHRLIYRELTRLDDLRQIFHDELDGIIPCELQTLLNAMELQRQGSHGRAREAFRNVSTVSETDASQTKKAA